jgi:hypothetical protein
VATVGGGFARQIRGEVFEPERTGLCDHGGGGRCTSPGRLVALIWPAGVLIIVSLLLGQTIFLGDSLPFRVLQSYQESRRSV